METQTLPNEAADTEREARGNFFSLVRGFSSAMLVSRAGESFNSRPMHVVEVADDGDLWFITSVDTAKIEEITRTSSVLVTMQGSRQFASIVGHAEIVRDRAKIESLWSETFRAYWKDPSDPSIALIHLESDQGEYWDDSGASGIKWAVRAATAALRGKPLDRNDDDVELHGRVKL